MEGIFYEVAGEVILDMSISTNPTIVSSTKSLNWFFGIGFWIGPFTTDFDSGICEDIPRQESISDLFVN